MFIIEHRLEDNEIYRSLILKANLNQTQSQNRVKSFPPDRLKQFPLAKEIAKKALYVPEEDGQIVGTDDSYLSFEFHRLMIAGLGLVAPTVQSATQFNVLILGGGAGILSKFFYYNFPNSKIDTVEISNNIIKVEVLLHFLTS
jgi:hypothetical protein